MQLESHYPHTAVNDKRSLVSVLSPVLSPEQSSLTDTHQKTTQPLIDKIISKHATADSAVVCDPRQHGNTRGMSRESGSLSAPLQCVGRQGLGWKGRKWVSRPGCQYDGSACEGPGGLPALVQCERLKSPQLAALTPQFPHRLQSPSWGQGYSGPPRELTHPQPLCQQSPRTGGSVVAGPQGRIESCWSALKWASTSRLVQNENNSLLLHPTCKY